MFYGQKMSKKAIVAPRSRCGLKCECARARRRAGVPAALAAHTSTQHVHILSS